MNADAVKGKDGKIRYPRTKKQRQIDVAELTNDEDVSLQKTGKLTPKSEDVWKHRYDKDAHMARLSYPANTKENFDKRYEHISTKGSGNVYDKNDFHYEEWSNAINKRLGPFTLYNKYKNRRDFIEKPADENYKAFLEPTVNKIILHGQLGKLSSTVAHELKHQEDFGGPEGSAYARLKKYKGYKNNNSDDYYTRKHHDEPAFEMNYYKELVKKRKK